MNNRIRLINTTAIALGVALLAVPAVAQDSATDIGSIVVGYSADGSPIYAAENTTSIDAAAAEGLTSDAKIDTALRREASVFTRVNAGTPGVAVNVRGFEGSGRVQMSVDGVPQNFRFTGHEAGGYAFVDQNLLAGVDITRGGTASTGGLSGAVNFRTIGADDVLAEGATSGGFVRLGYGQNGEQFNATVATATRGANFDLVGAITTRDSNSYENGAGTTVANSWQDTQSILLKGTYRIDATQSLTFSAMRYESDYAANSYNQTATSNVVSAGYKLDRNDGLVDLTANIYSNNTDLLYTSAITSGSAVGRLQEVHTIGANVANVSHATFGGWTMVSNNGFDISRDSLDGNNTGVNPAEGEAGRYAVFSENVFSLNRLEVTAGLRYSGYSIDADIGSDAVEESESEFLPSVSLAYAVTDWMQPYISWSRTMRAPTLQETILGGNAHGVGMIANPDLLPEVSTGVEVGVKFAREGLFLADDRMTARVSYYNMEVENYVTSGTITNRFGTTGIGYTNIAGESQVSGVELEVTYAASLFDVALTYSNADSELPSQFPGLGAGQYLPDDKVGLVVAGNFLNDTLRVGATYDYVSGGLVAGYNSSFNGGAATQSDTSYELYGLFADYKVTEQLSMNVKVSNLFDEEYTPWLATAGSGEGRNLYVGANYRF